MSISISGDKEFENIPSIKSKALRINLNENDYHLNLKSKLE